MNVGVSRSLLNLEDVTILSLAFPCFEKSFVLHTDACEQGLGAVLEQESRDGELHPVAFASRTLTPQERKYGITDLEALGIVWAPQHFRPYLLGHHSIVYTDHAPLKSMLTAQHASGKLARWGETLSELDLDICYRPGRKNANADELSRAPLECTEENREVTNSKTVAALREDSDPSFTELEVDREAMGEDFYTSPEIVDLQRQDPGLQEIISHLQKSADKKGARDSPTLWSWMTFCTSWTGTERSTTNCRSRVTEGAAHGGSTCEEVLRTLRCQGPVRDPSLSILVGWYVLGCTQTL